MAISDINKMMAMYAQPTEFDQNAWKTAFDIANSFATVSENHRKNRENLATEDWRVSLANAQNKANTVAQQNALTQQQGVQQLYQLTPQLMVDDNGKIRSNEEIFNIARQDQNLNPALYQQLLGNYQKEAQTAAQEIAQINPQMASQYRTIAGLSPNLVDNSGNVINFNSGEVVGAIAPEQLANFASGNYWQNALLAQKATQEAQKAQAIAEARLPYTLEAIEARANAAQQKQENWQQHKTDEAQLKQVNDFISQAVSGAQGDKTKLNLSLGALVQQYPNLREHIGKQAAMQMQLGTY